MFPFASLLALERTALAHAVRAGVYSHIRTAVPGVPGDESVRETRGSHLTGTVCEIRGPGLAAWPDGGLSHGSVGRRTSRPEAGAFLLADE